MIINSLRRWVRSVDRRVWLGLLGIGLVILVIVAIPVQPGVTDVAQLQPTLDAAATQQNIQYPTLRAALTLTPIEAMITQAAPTLAMAGLTEVRQYAASASADNSRGEVDWNAVQAAGPPNTEVCGDSRTAYATLNPNGLGTLTLAYPQLVLPTRINVHQSFNPGFVRQIDVRDVYGEIHTVYTAQAALQATCPAVLTVDIEGADYPVNTVILLVDQITSTGGWAEIDAVELVGTKYN